ncbi:hypothetical protein CU254_26255 [Amycolatopsis sp. AA4]|uniref:5-methylcytosine restriction system specificity protein McrC n=1 Tax=Actinomycetes TaxID=1760 RepID=UPI0001B550BC|nr:MULTISPECIES: hypothetical protein [Actinomycetes]ATY13538.1 hypothetical protein CU254_26255 [Amycolatopsis sp. AA4]EFL09503.1 predicted protein [Streptomyces sp. AA4]
MTDRIVFADLAGPVERDRVFTAEEDQWLVALAVETRPEQFTLNLAPSCASADPQPILERRLDGGWRAGRYVGELRRDGRILEIRPRLGIDTIASWASAALNLHTVPRAAEARGNSALIAELTAALWRAALTAAARHGLPSFRTRRGHVGSAVRGSLDSPGTFALRAARSPFVASVERAKLLGNPVSQVIVAADQVLDTLLHHRPGWRGDRVEEIVPRLRESVGARPRLPSLRDLRSVRYTPITLPYKRVADLSWQIVQRTAPQASPTDERTHGLLIDVAELWELFLLRCARRATALPVTHGTQYHVPAPLLRSARHPTAVLGRLFPDILIGPAESPTAIVDAKYKPLNDRRGVDREDLYQLNAYLTAHNAELGALVYPTLDQHPSPLIQQRNPWLTHQNRPMHFTQVPITEGACVRALTELLTDGHENTRNRAPGHDLPSGAAGRTRGP